VILLYVCSQLLLLLLFLIIVLFLIVENKISIYLSISLTDTKTTASRQDSADLDLCKKRNCGKMLCIETLKRIGLLLYVGWTLNSDVYSYK